MERHPTFIKVTAAMTISPVVYIAAPSCAHAMMPGSTSDSQQLSRCRKVATVFSPMSCRLAST
eukprot:46603-Eustigmatos_ZCMA.PRE.1